jgi:hypothetical protein
LDGGGLRNGLWCVGCWYWGIFLDWIFRWRVFWEVRLEGCVSRGGGDIVE